MSAVFGLRRALAARLEHGSFDSGLARALSRAWAHRADPVRPLALPRGARVVGIGGATLGGSGKTPVALALARLLQAHAKVVVVASGYRARLDRPRVVSANDAVGEVGDEALMLARALNVPVIAGKLREAALELAASLGELVIVDGLLQTRPVRLGCSFLVLDGDRPWGAGCCPPAGDLRAERERLIAASDAVLATGAFSWREHRVLGFERRLEGARDERGVLRPLAELSRARLGLALAIARPERVIGDLRRSKIEPARVVLAADHEKPALKPGRSVSLDAWLVTAKCATKLDKFAHGVPVWTLEESLRLPAAAGELALGRSLRTEGRAVVGSAPCSSGEPSRI